VFVYLCQRILLLWRESYVSEEQGVVLEEDKDQKEYSFSFKGRAWHFLALGVVVVVVGCLPCRVTVEFQQSQKG
jgi:hypothetical protein